MHSDLKAYSRFRLRLVAPCPHAGALTPALARVTGLHPDEMADRLAAGAGVLFETEEETRARAALARLRALGLPVLIEDGQAGCDLSVTAASDVPVAALAALTWLPGPVVAAGLAGPEGLVLAGRDRAEAEAEARRLRAVRGVKVVVSDPEAAVFDLHGPRPAPGLLADLRRLGLGPCPLTGALAFGLDRQMARLMERRHGVRAMNRDFLRFDLWLTGRRGMGPREMADFLGPRVGLSAAALAEVSPTRPLRIEAGLSLAGARQFAADYAAIGLAVRLRLAGAGRDGR